MTKKEIVGLLEEVGCNTLTGKETLKELEACLADAIENGVPHKLTEADFEANPALAEKTDEREALATGDDVRLPFPKEKVPQPEGDNGTASETAPAAEPKRELKADKSGECEVELTENVKVGGTYHKKGETVTVKLEDAQALHAAGLCK